MTGNTSKAVLLSIHELLLLLYKREISGIVFPEEISEASADEAQLKNAMKDLINDGYLVPGDDGSYHISEEMDEILNTMRDASCTYVVMGDHMKLNVRYVYRYNNDGVELTMDQRRPGWVKLLSGQVEDILKNVTEYDFMPEDGLDSVVTETVDDSVYETAESGELMNSQAVYLLIERYRKGKGSFDRRTFVTRESDQDRIINASGGANDISPYQTETFVDKILED